MFSSISFNPEGPFRRFSCPPARQAIIDYLRTTAGGNVSPYQLTPITLLRALYVVIIRLFCRAVDCMPPPHWIPTLSRIH